MTERSIFSTIVQAELARWHEECHELLIVVSAGGTDAEIGAQMKRLFGLLPDDLRPGNIPPTPYVTHPKKKPNLDDLL